MTLLTNLHVGSANVPDRLRQRHHWVCWDDRDGRKIPIDSRTGDPAKSNDPATWSDFQTATDAADRLKLSGIGYVFSDDDGMVGIDLDECIDDRGKIAEWALVILSRFDSYAEISPSGRGLKLWCIGEIDKGRKHIISKRDSGKSPGIEMYSSGRYFTVTGGKGYRTPQSRAVSVIWTGCRRNTGRQPLSLNRLFPYRTSAQTESACRSGPPGTWQRFRRR